MAEVSFYTGVADRLGFVCRLLRKASLSGATVAVVGPTPLLDRLDQALWTFEATEFVPHLRLRAQGDAGRQEVRSPILLSESAQLAVACRVLLNIGTELVPGFERYERVLEVVSQDPQQVQAGRLRFKHYKAQGHSVVHHEVSA